MTDEQKPKIENLAQQEAELTPEQAEAAQGGGSAVSHEIISPRDPASKTESGIVHTEPW